jgi:hypothetical protein
MQDDVNQHIRNGFECCYPHPVTCLSFGNYPVNALVTQMLQYSAGI